MQLHSQDRHALRYLVDLSSVEQERRALMWETAARQTSSGLSVRLAEMAPATGLIRRVQMGTGQLLRIQSEPAEVNYQPPAGDNRNPHFSVVMQFRGSTIVSQIGQSCELREGDMCLLDESKPFRLESFDTSGLVIARLPRAAVLSRYPHLERLCASILCGSETGTRLVGDMLLRLAHDADDLGELQRSAMVSGIIQMLGIAGPVSEAPTAANWRVHKAVEFIERNLSVPGLTAEAVARDQGISRRRLDQLLHEAFGHSITHHLWSRRLDQAATDLQDPHRADRSITQIAFSNGFESAAHFARVFKLRFSVTPKQWRLSS